MIVRKPCLLAIAALTALISSRPASAHMLPLTDRRLAAVSTDVVVAVVESSHSRWNAEGSLIVTDYSLRIEDRLKGGVPERLTLTIPGGTVGDETHGTCVSTPLAEGARYVLFLDQPEGSGVSPVTGGWQGVFQEIDGADGKRWVGRGRSRAVVVSPRNGEPMELADFIRSVRGLVDRAPALHEPADLVWLTREPLTTADGAKSTVRNPAVPPIAFSTLLAGTPFEGVEQEAMEKWNRYAADLFLIPPAPAATWSFGNGVSEIVGFPEEAELQQGLGRGWGSQGAVAIASWRIRDGHIVETDIAFNPARSWSLDDAEASVLGGPLPFRDFLLSELAGAWGDLGPFGFGPFQDFPIVSRDSVMNLRSQDFQQAVLFGEDADAVRATYPGTTVRDGLISNYIVVPSLLTPSYIETRPSPATVRTGGRFLLSSVKIENPGTETLVNPAVDIYLVPRRFSLEGAIRLKRINSRMKLTRGAAQNLNLGSITLPRKAAPGTYYFAFVLRDPKDAYQDNNTAWGSARLTVTR